MLSLKQWQSREAGRKQPVWIHVGGGNLYRAFHAAIAQDLIDAGELSRGVVVMETFRPFTVDELYKPYDDDILQVIMNPDGSLSERVLASTADALFANVERPEDWARAKAYFESPELQLVTVTITEKGYALRTADGSFSAQAESDFASGPAAPKTTMALPPSPWSRPTTSAATASISARRSSMSPRHGRRTDSWTGALSPMCPTSPR